jgi:hypothetical protein
MMAGRRENIFMPFVVAKVGRRLNFRNVTRVDCRLVSQWLELSE